jgi:hypothetical protein
MRSTTYLLGRGWTFTQIGGGQGTEDGKWLKTSVFPTTVHVELLNLKIIPDPVSISNCLRQRDVMYSLTAKSSSDSTSGMYSVRATARYATRRLNSRADRRALRDW